MEKKSGDVPETDSEEKKNGESSEQGPAIRQNSSVSWFRTYSYSKIDSDAGRRKSERKAGRRSCCEFLTGLFSNGQQNRTAIVLGWDDEKKRAPTRVKRSNSLKSSGRYSFDHELVRSYTLPVTDREKSSRKVRKLGGLYDPDCPIPMGDLEILEPQPAKLATSTYSNMSDPVEVKHIGHATYEPITRHYEGIPGEWHKELQKQFGLNPDELESIHDPKYKSRIPSILVQMKDYLYEFNGLDTMGIFRIAPDNDQAEHVKHQLNCGTFEKCDDINCIANLIKVWFRELPDHVLSVVSSHQIDQIADKNNDADDDLHEVGDLLMGFPEPSKSMFFWLLDVCVDVSMKADINRMTAQNIAIVMAPNLYNNTELPPLEAIAHSQKVARFMHKAINWRANNPPDPPILADRLSSESARSNVEMGDIEEVDEYSKTANK